jgi:hypothetical protein
MKLNLLHDLVQNIQKISILEALHSDLTKTMENMWKLYELLAETSGYDSSIADVCWPTEYLIRFNFNLISFRILWIIVLIWSVFPKDSKNDKIENISQIEQNTPSKTHTTKKQPHGLTKQSKLGLSSAKLRPILKEIFLWYYKFRLPVIRCFSLTIRVYTKFGADKRTERHGQI